MREQTIAIFHKVLTETQLQTLFLRPKYSGIPQTSTRSLRRVFNTTHSGNEPRDNSPEIAGSCRHRERQECAAQSIDHEPSRIVVCAVNQSRRLAFEPLRYDRIMESNRLFCLIWCGNLRVNNFTLSHKVGIVRGNSSRLMTNPYLYAFSLITRKGSWPISQRYSTSGSTLQ